MEMERVRFKDLPAFLLWRKDMPVGYKLRAGNPDALLSEQQTADQTLYVRTAAEGGNDLSGDGSASFPYLTIDRAVKDVSVVSRYKTTVDIGAGIMREKMT